MELVLPRAELRVVRWLALVSAASFTEFAAYPLLQLFIHFSPSLLTPLFAAVSFQLPLSLWVKLFLIVLPT